MLCSPPGTSPGGDNHQPPKHSEGTVRRRAGTGQAAVCQVGSVPASSPRPAAESSLAGQSWSPFLHPHQPRSAPQLLATSWVPCRHPAHFQAKGEEHLPAGSSGFAPSQLSLHTSCLGRASESLGQAKPGPRVYLLPSSTLKARTDTPTAAGEPSSPPRDAQAHPFGG